MEDKQKLRECNFNNYTIDMSLSDQCCSDNIKIEDHTLNYEVTDNNMEHVKVEIKSEMEEYNVINDEKSCISGRKSSSLSNLSIERFLRKEQEIEIIETVSDSLCKEEHVNEQPEEKTINSGIHSFGPFKCEICSQEFFSARQLRRHVRTHVAEKPFKCHIFSKELSQADHFNIKKHITTRTEKKSFKCEICSLEFSSAFQVGRHVKTHTVEQPFKCYICSKEFSQSDYFNIEKHMTTHTEKKSFKCEICSQEFSSAVQVERHVKTHTEEKPLKGYITIKTHMTTHTEKKSFKCEICSREFSSSVQVGRLVRTHVPEKPFKCYICSKKFYRADDLKKYMTAHIEKKPFKCEICTENINLCKHMEMHSERFKYKVNKRFHDIMISEKDKTS